MKSETQNQNKETDKKEKNTPANGQNNIHFIVHLTYKTQGMRFVPGNVRVNVCV